jgi:methylase of polypeptide subunit release factors
MAQKLEDGKIFTEVLDLNKESETFRVLELGSGTGLGGLFASAQLQKQTNGQKIELYMTDLCEKSLDAAFKNVELNSQNGV